jgi:hypothetical protein
MKKYFAWIADAARRTRDDSYLSIVIDRDADDFFLIPNPLLSLYYILASNIAAADTHNISSVTKHWLLSPQTRHCVSDLCNTPSMDSSSILAD